MKSLVIFKYRQPVNGTYGYRVGVLSSVRDCEKNPVDNTYYRWMDAQAGRFQRTKTLWTVREFRQIKRFYAERLDWKLEIPYLGTLLSPFFA